MDTILTNRFKAAHKHKPGQHEFFADCKHDKKGHCLPREGVGGPKEKPAKGGLQKIEEPLAKGTPKGALYTLAVGDQKYIIAEAKDGFHVLDEWGGFVGDAHSTIKKAVAFAKDHAEQFPWKAGISTILRKGEESQVVLLKLGGYCLARVPNRKYVIVYKSKKDDWEPPARGPK